MILATIEAIKIADRDQIIDTIPETCRQDELIGKGRQEFIIETNRHKSHHPDNRNHRVHQLTIKLKQNMT